MAEVVENERQLFNHQKQKSNYFHIPSSKRFSKYGKALLKKYAPHGHHSPSNLDVQVKNRERVLSGVTDKSDSFVDIGSIEKSDSFIDLDPESQAI